MSIGRAARLGGTGGTSVQQTQAPELPSPLLPPSSACISLARHVSILRSLSLSRYFETPPSIGNPPPPPLCPLDQPSRRRILSLALSLSEIQVPFLRVCPF